MTQFSEETWMGINNAADIVRGSKKAIALTGAGISTPSGISDFRSTDNGLWTHYDPFEVASLNSFRYDPEKFFNWMRPLAIDIYRALPNAAHYGIAKLEKFGYIQTVITQNIDTLHQKAGSKNVLEVHGTIERLTCIGCFRKYSAEGFIEPYIEGGKIPRCLACGDFLKPDLVLFGEQLPAETWLKANQASKNCDLMIVVGSSLEVLPVAGLPMRALENGAHLILVNQSETYLDVRADVVLHEDVATVIPAIVNIVLGE